MKQSILETVTYGGWPHCLRLSDGKTEVIIPTAIGIRVMRFGFIGGRNVLKEYKDQLGNTGGKHWRIYGGHRLWVAPEIDGMTNLPDNDPITFAWRKPHLTLRQKPDQRYGIGKEIRLRYRDDGSLELRHRITLCGKKSLTMAPWSLTVMATDGEAVIPQEPYGPHPQYLAPARPVVLWSYTKMNDPRWTWGDREIRLRQDPKSTTPQKAGFLSTQGWMAYELEDYTFIKHHDFLPGRFYPDFNCNVQTYTDKDMLELETLGPLTKLAPGRHVDHTEIWMLKRGKARS